MNREEEMQQLKGRIAAVYALREDLKSALENGALVPAAGFAQLGVIDGELSYLDTRFKTLWDDSHPHANVPPHPAALWALGTDFEPVHLDCVTAIMLKILDGKCKMGAAEQRALTAIYEVVKVYPNQGLADEVHSLIAAARQRKDVDLADRIHLWRVRAEAHIPKPVMKGFKRLLRASLSIP